MTKCDACEPERFHELVVQFKNDQGKVCSLCRDCLAAGLAALQQKLLPPPPAPAAEEEGGAWSTATDES